MIFNNSAIFRKLLASSILVIAGTLLFLDIDLKRFTGRKERESTEQRLAAQAAALLGEIVRLSPEELPSWARKTAQRAGIRVTVVDPGGVVLSDSERNPQTMENHSDRPEIRQALQNGRGAAVRYSATLGRDLCYVALSLSLDGRAGHILRLAVPL